MKPVADDLRIAGLVRLSTCDWPGELTATIFCQGCGWACPYCHNPALRPARGTESIAWSRVLEFLKARVKLLDGVVFSGGEPTLQPALRPALEAVKQMGFGIGLHTAGPSVRKLAPLLPLLDWVGFDVKAPFADYARITGVAGSGDQASACLQLLLASGMALEVRTTVHPALLGSADLELIRRQLLQMGVPNFVLQQVRADGVEAGSLLPFPAPPMPALVADFGAGFTSFQQR